MPDGANGSSRTFLRRKARGKAEGSIPASETTGQEAHGTQAGSLAGVAPSRLVLDALEPRVLLSADVLTIQLANLPNDTHANDVLVRVVHGALEVGAQTQMVEHVQVIDTALGNAVLAEGDAAAVGHVAIMGDANAVHVEIDAASFAGGATPAIQTDVTHKAVAEANTLAIDHDAASPGHVADQCRRHRLSGLR
jgi:hypothetical protein